MTVWIVSFHIFYLAKSNQNLLQHGYHCSYVNDTFTSQEENEKHWFLKDFFEFAAK